jgi:hypothetical protein
MRNTSKILIGTTATRAFVSNEERTAIGIANMSGTATIFVGADSETSTDNGFPIYPGTQITFNHGNGDNTRMARWIISTGVGTDVRLIEEFGGE